MIFKLGLLPLTILTPILILVLILEGCSTTTIIIPERRSTDDVGISYERLNRILNEGLIRNATVRLADGHEFDAQEILVERDSTLFVDTDAGKPRRVLTPGILRIQRTDRFLGVLEGLFFGTLAGGALGFGLASTSSDEGEWSGFGKAISTALGIIAGGTAGLITGVIRGHQSTYEFVRDTVEAPHDKTLR